MYGKCNGIYQFTIKQQLIDNSIMIITRNDSHVSQLISCWLFNNLFHNRCFDLFEILNNKHCPFWCHFLSRHMFLFLFRFKHCCTFLRHLLFKNIFHATQVFICTLAWKTFQIFSHFSWQCSMLYSCFGMFLDLSNKTHLFLRTKPSKWSGSTERFLNFGSFSFLNFLK